MLIVERSMTVALPVAPHAMPKMSFMQPDVPSLLPPPRCPLHDLLNSLAVVAPLGFHVCS